MATSYDDALSTLYRAPHETFVAERKRLSAELKADGDTAGSTRLAQLGRPTISAWTVNQLFWQSPEGLEELFAAAERVRAGAVNAAVAHREVIAKLRARALRILRDAGHATTDATLRRITTTLAALAASGGFEPDPPGALAGDRDPPGFEAAGISDALPEPSFIPRTFERPKKKETTAAGIEAAKATGAERPPKAAAGKPELAETRRLQKAEQARERKQAADERRRIEKERAKSQAERRRLEAALHTAKRELSAREREREKFRSELAKVEHGVKQAEGVVEDLEARLAST